MLINGYIFIYNHLYLYFCFCSFVLGNHLYFQFYLTFSALTESRLTEVYCFIKLTKSINSKKKYIYYENLKYIYANVNFWQLEILFWQNFKLLKKSQNVQTFFHHFGRCLKFSSKKPQIIIHIDCVYIA